MYHTVWRWCVCGLCRRVPEAEDEDRFIRWRLRWHWASRVKAWRGFRQSKNMRECIAVEQKWDFMVATRGFTPSPMLAMLEYCTKGCIVICDIEAMCLWCTNLYLILMYGFAQLFWGRLWYTFVDGPLVFLVYIVGCIIRIVRAIIPYSVKTQFYWASPHRRKSCIYYILVCGEAMWHL